MLPWFPLVKIKFILLCQKPLAYLLLYATLDILNGKITTPGVQIPISKEVYEPILKELEDYGIVFHEKEVPYFGYNPLNV